MDLEAQENCWKQVRNEHTHTHIHTHTKKEERI